MWNITKIDRYIGFNQKEKKKPKGFTISACKLSEIFTF